VVPHGERGHHLDARQVEYPWYAAWDLAFHTLPLAIVDPDFAKDQMKLMLRGVYLHPSGQMPAYEWNFSDVNPPVHAFATLFLHRTEQALRGEVDIDFLKSAFNKLLLNFTWWVNRKDRFGRTSSKGASSAWTTSASSTAAPRFPPAATWSRRTARRGWPSSARTCWSSRASSPSTTNYEDMIPKFAEHFYYIAAAMNRPGQDGMWDEEDASTTTCCGSPTQRHAAESSLDGGLLPLCATTVIEACSGSASAGDGRDPGTPAPDARAPGFHPPHGPGTLRCGGPGIVALVNPERLRRILTKMLDEDEFLSPYGIRSISGSRATPVRLPRERHGVPGGLPAGRVEHRHVRRQLELAGPGLDAGERDHPPGAAELLLYYGDNFKIECPTGSGKMMNLFEVSQEIATGSPDLLRDERGRRPVYGGTEKFQSDPHWRDLLLFYEYFHGDNGAGLGASHQTGWTGLVAKSIQLYGLLDSKRALEGASRPLSFGHRSVL